MININIDYSTPIGTFRKYQKSVTHISLLRGPLDRQRVSELELDNIICYYAPRDLVTSEYTEFSYDFNHYGGNYYGDDSIVDEAVAVGATPIIIIYPSNPKWVGGGYYALPYKNDNIATPNTDWSWVKYDQMISDILMHIKTKYPQVTELRLFEEASGSVVYNPDSDAPPNHRYQWHVWGATGEIYKEFYDHVSNVVLNFNAENNHTFELSPTSLGIGKISDLNTHKQILSYFRNKLDNNVPVSFNGISWDHYNFSNISLEKEYVDEASLASYNPCAIALRSLMDEYNIPNDFPVKVTQYTGVYYLKYFNSDWAARACAATVAVWKDWMDLQDINIQPWYWALNDYGSPASALIRPRHCSIKPTTPALLADKIRIDALLDAFKDGTIFPMYNVFKMMNMQKEILFSSNSPPTVWVPTSTISGEYSGVFIIPTGDNNGIVAMISRVYTGDDINVIIKNLPSSFQNGTIRVEKYLIDYKTSNAINGGQANQELKKISDEIIEPTYEYTTILSPSDTYSKYSVTLIKMTPSEIDSCPPPIYNYTISQQ